MAVTEESIKALLRTSVLQQRLAKYLTLAYSTEIGHPVQCKLDSRSVATRGVFFTPDLQV